MIGTRPDQATVIPRFGLNRVELATAIGVSANSVDLMVREGILPPPRRWHSRKIWLVADVLAAMASWPEDGGVQPGATGEDAGDDWEMSA